MTDDAPRVVADLWNRIIVLLADLEPEDWERPTPCAGWDVHDLAAHLSGLQTQFDGAAQPKAPEGWAPPAGASPIDSWTAAGVAARRGWPPEDVLEELHAARDGHVARVSQVGDWTQEAVGPLGPTDEAGLLEVRLFDIWVHLQDLRVAIGLPVEAGDASAAARIVYRYLWQRVPWLFAKRVGAPEGSTLRVRLRAPAEYDGVVEIAQGRGRWRDDADPGRCVVSADPAAFVLLLSGRGDPETWRGRGLLEWDGDRGEELVRLGRLFG